MFHRVKVGAEISRFPSKRRWEVTPEYLESILKYFLQSDYDILPLGTVVKRLEHPCPSRRFVAFTFDDGYTEHASIVYPLFKKYQIPFTVYVSTSFAEGRATLAEEIVENIIRKEERIIFETPNGIFSEASDNPTKRLSAYEKASTLLEVLPPKERECCLVDLGKRNQLDICQFRKKECLNWENIGQMATDPLVTIGAHSVNHLPLASLDETQALFEMRESKKQLENKLTLPVVHFAYPYGHPASAGSREFQLADKAGFKTAVTTVAGNVYPAFKNHLHSLYRINVDGRFASLKALEMSLCGYEKARARVFNRYELKT